MNPEFKNTAKALVASGLAAGISTAAILPIDTVSDTQKQWRMSRGDKQLNEVGKSFVATAKEIYKPKVRENAEGGVAPFYSGMGGKIMKVAPSQALTFTMVPAIKKIMKVAALVPPIDTPEGDPNTSPYERMLWHSIPYPRKRTMFDKALLGRINSGEKLYLPAEREIAAMIPAKPEGKKYITDQLMTNPLTAGAISGGTVYGGLQAAYYAAPLWKKMQTTMANSANQFIRELAKVTAADVHVGAEATEEALKLNKKGFERAALKAALMTALPIAALRVAHGPAILGEAELAKQKGLDVYDPSAYILTKVRGDM